MDFAAPPGTVGECTSDADCAHLENGYCTFGQDGYSYCVTGCIEDSDCGDGQVCDCGSFVGTCVAATCTTDADCPGDSLCTAYDAEPGCAFTTFACQTPQDTCGGDADCAVEGGELCSASESGVRQCMGVSCAIGRPFLVAGTHRLAQAARRSDWSVPGEEPDVANLEQNVRAAIGEAWTRVALMEHASVAAFARFTLELLAFGAPAELVARATRAQADEVRHAAMAFRLASEYAKKPVGAAPLDVSGCLDGTSFEKSFVNAVLEGCIGETLAAVEAAEAKAHARDAAVVKVLEQVVVEESEHAELAFRFVKWALARDAGLAPLLRSTLAAALAAEAEAAERAQAGPWDDALLAAGVLSERVRSVVRPRALRDVVVPCIEALLADEQETEFAAPVTLPRQ